MKLLHVRDHINAARLRTRSIALAQGPLLAQSRRHHRRVRLVHNVKAALWASIEVATMAAIFAALCRACEG
jgi:hypothetical protein